VLDAIAGIMKMSNGVREKAAKGGIQARGKTFNHSLRDGASETRKIVWEGRLW